VTPAHASLPVPTSDIERRVLGDIARHGWHVVLVRRGTHDHEGRGPWSDHPAAQHAHAYLNVVGEMVQEGQSLASGDTTDELLEGFSVRFGAVADTPRLHLLTWADWVMQRQPFGAVQLVLPDTTGRWPDDPDYNAFAQPLLA
jgi:hypothetical protein